MFRTQAYKPFGQFQFKSGIVGPSDRPPARLFGLGDTDMPGGSSLLPDAGGGGIGATVAIAGSQLLGVGGSALYGGAVGGVAAKSWSGAGTGALMGASVAALSYGGMNAVMGFAVPSMWAPAAIMLGAGAVGGYFTYRRWRG